VYRVKDDGVPAHVTRAARERAFSLADLPDGREFAAAEARTPVPGRNEPCWCGSARKYKKCCGTPGFAAPSSEHLGDHEDDQG